MPLRCDMRFEKEDKKKFGKRWIRTRVDRIKKYTVPSTPRFFLYLFCQLNPFDIYYILKVPLIF